MNLADGRAPRKTAGNRMSGLLQAEEEDDFYKTTYGGFNEESGDEEYNEDRSASEDEVDSDFDIDEGDEPTSDHEEDEPKKKRRVVTKAYKEPIQLLKPKPKKPEAPPNTAAKSRPEKPQEPPDDTVDSRKQMRQSTTEHTRQTFLRVKERQIQSKKKKGPHLDRPLTQEELLEEAKITEEINIRSLENYERLEADRKKQVHKKRRCAGPTIRYHSMVMPLITELRMKEENVDVEGLDHEQTDRTHAGKCSRSFITFSDDETFERFFPRSKRGKFSVRDVCPVTHKPALYRDPITDIPYYNSKAFKIIRDAYKKYITTHGLPNAAMATTMGPSADAAQRNTRQKIIIKQSVPSA
ncbi:vacuolar protein sorting-associated protein 72 homolog [Xenopus laevis]|uniref:Vacuolar protein sorting-associated protein 72 homolog n=1 Tax=Xenopus laevis TaxID=8355 RepID=VPS72_XENLA|nr:vacuolar protein sorting-associated protein 72 homolog [Xenopus laevis]Q6GNJ8.1 RecName: Full=Vacuolar protein sorting-associated protein 72 homolog; AltName: Full=Transcription factor-like 1 [Xenopus laevis]AAH73511.1 MGC82727 protein [Xenopus laevis]